jgi:protein farnesyltransferase/geranylgeranyltransferase type-1 subunit alpha
MTEPRHIGFDYSDVIPIPPPQEDHDPFFVQYSPKHSRLFGLFNSLISGPEVSPRALALSEAVISAFPNHYTAWWYKFHILADLGYDPEIELNFVSRSISSQPKCYQAWHYRRWIVDRLPEAPDEFPLLTATFDHDPKNFHAWAYGLWYAERWDKRAEFFQLTKAEITRDCRNNSAWTIRRTIGLAIGADPAVEFEEAAASLRVVSKNEAVCNFLLAVAKGNMVLMERIRPLAEQLIAQKPDNRFALWLLLSVAKDQPEIEQICGLLMSADPVRQPFYTMIKQGIIKAF